MELTFKVVLDKRHQKKNDSYPLKLRVFQNRLFKECSLNIDIPEIDWDINKQVVLATNANFTVLNTKLASTKAKVQRFIFLSEDLETTTTPEKVIDHLKNKEQKQNVITNHNLLKYGREHIAKLKIAGKIGSAITYTCGINKLQEFAKTDMLPFDIVDYRFLENFQTTLLSEGIKINSIGNYLRSVRALFNMAIKEGLVDAKSYPFTSFKIKTERTISRTLTKGEISQILRLELATDSAIWHHRNLFALSFFFIGINFSDLLTLTKENFVDDRLVFRRNKTRKIYSIKVSAKAKEISDYYFTELPNCNKEFVLPFIENKNNPIRLKKDILQTIKSTNQYLKKIVVLCGINKKVTTYYARYSWANLSRELGYSKDMIAEALGHEYGNKVTSIYLDHYDNSIIDEMNSKVINSVVD